MDQVHKNVASLCKEHFDWLLPLWEKVKDLHSTRTLIETSWDSLVRLLETEKKIRPSTRTAPQLTLKRFAGWESRFLAWREHKQIQAVARTERADRAAHHLSCIINHVEEVNACVYWKNTYFVEISWKSVGHL